MSKKKEPIVVSAYSDMPERVIFTEEMRKTHTILIPNMLPRHFRIIEQVFKNYGYKTEILEDGLHGDAQTVSHAAQNNTDGADGAPAGTGANRHESRQDKADG